MSHYVQHVEDRLVSRLGREEQADTPDVVVLHLECLIKLSLNCEKMLVAMVVH